MRTPTLTCLPLLPPDACVEPPPDEFDPDDLLHLSSYCSSGSLERVT